MASREYHRCIPPLVPGLSVEKADGLKREREKLADHHWSVCGKVVPRAIIPSLSPTALQPAVKNTAQLSVKASPAPCIYQASAAVGGESKCPERSFMDVDRSAELHTAMPSQCLPLHLPWFISCLSPLLISREACLNHAVNMWCHFLVWRNDSWNLKYLFTI